MLQKNILGIAALTATAVLAGACGNDNDNNATVLDRRIAVIDTNGDLVVSVAEWNAAFVVFDVNGDGVLTTTEFQFNAAGFAVADVDRNGFVTAAEWNATLADWDVNQDLLLEPSEFDPFL